MKVQHGTVIAKGDLVDSDTGGDEGASTSSPVAAVGDRAVAVEADNLD